MVGTDNHITLEEAATAAILYCAVPYLVAVDDSPLLGAFVAAQNIAQPAVVLSTEHSEMGTAQVASVGGLGPVPLLLPGRIDLVCGGGKVDRDEAVHPTAASCTQNMFQTKSIATV